MLAQHAHSPPEPLPSPYLRNLRADISLCPAILDTERKMHLQRLPEEGEREGGGGKEG